ncbi:uncharacterized protein LACBIDRAFT_303334 [Laccaria bicolor S238N-H82]|uniref:Predicted protein n=1 Tax=Laccaria bicolor (strain S238N-H82 / ATCC MYA-4686) TaxID=486041 RepID=B0DJC3_LACBS|nr:uncharacterized protein LACBIDRAFT_303334 [Laccaria bicolor S238N-H82]EDR05380.1 predicted protein [Laccaria bicolor S238N-H82]|eukprot:XP_001883938.1 predicted protein [Laccaria bicolor S238N-H82]
MVRGRSGGRLNIRYLSLPRPVTAAEKTTSVLSILGSESSARDCKNQLMELFDFQSFHITAKIVTSSCGVPH